VILALCLLAVVGGLLLTGPRLLARLTRSCRLPMSSVIAWQATSWAVPVSLVSAGALVALPSLPDLRRFPGALQSCAAAIGHVLRPTDNTALKVAAAAVLVAALLRLSSCAARGWVANHKHRAALRTLLSLVAKHDPGLCAHIVEDDRPVVYCLPGRGGRIVVTSAAVQRLSPAQCAAVLAHERAHLRGRHHLLIASATLLARAFPGVALFAQCREQTTRLVEMRADDVAARGHGRRPVAEALLALTGVMTPEPVLAAAGVTAATRIERLLHGPSSQRSALPGIVVHGVGVVVTATLLTISPLLLALAGHAALCLL
jgi:Zn-dependent protease with chaperone function